MKDTLQFDTHRRNIYPRALVIGIIVALQGFGSAGAALQQPQSPSRATAAPQVSGRFQGEVARLAGEGLTLKEAFEADLDGGAHHLAAIFQRATPKPEQAMEACEFRIIESDDRSAKTIFRRPDFSFSFPRALPRPNGSDINGDGIKEVIVDSSSGGNCWACNPTEIYQVRNHKVELIAAGPLEIKDLNGDGVVELIVTDTRWEGYDDFSHAGAPSSIIVYAWKNGRYSYASPDFKAYYEEVIRKTRSEINEARAEITEDKFSDEGYIGRAVSLAITCAHQGDIERGLKELESLLKLNSKSAEQTKHRAEILEDFRSGDSSKKLREMKYGDRMPLN